MKRINQGYGHDQIEYHLGRNDTPDFSVGQPGRIDLARFLVDKILRKDLVRRPIQVIELGCGSGDISGPYSDPGLVITRDLSGFDLKFFDTESEPGPGDINVLGIDVVPQAAISCGQRWPQMDVIISPIEVLQPIECDLLIMCEFLEHVNDPIEIVKAWLPKAKWAIIGHPLNEPSPPYETGHIWSYTREDWYAWFEMAGHHVWERFEFPMGYYDAMVLGHSCRTDQPPFAA